MLSENVGQVQPLGDVPGHISVTVGYLAYRQINILLVPKRVKMQGTDREFSTCYIQKIS